MYVETFSNNISVLPLSNDIVIIEHSPSAFLFNFFSVCYIDVNSLITSLPLIISQRFIRLAS